VVLNSFLVDRSWRRRGRNVHIWLMRRRSCSVSWGLKPRRL
jgi:hypothetical protein